GSRSLPSVSFWSAVVVSQYAHERVNQRRRGGPDHVRVIGRDGCRRGAAGAEERCCPWSEGMAVGVRETRQDTMERDEIFDVKRRTQPMTNKGGAERANYEQLRDLSVLRDRPGVAELADLRS